MKSKVEKGMTCARDGYTWTGTAVQDKSLLQDRKLMRGLLLRMWETRKFEEKVIWLFAQGLVYGTMHPGIGEEATAVGSTAALTKDDYMFATHRGHGQAIGKGVDINSMMCEILSRENGTNHGRGGSMHLADPDKGILGANGILGASAPLACGAALAVQMKDIKNRVVADFFGDGASNQGAIHESMNLAATWHLPVMFIIINNTYGMSTPLTRVVNDVDLTKRGIPYGIKSFECDGNDVLWVYETVKKARSYCLRHKEPVLIVEHTYRTSGHSKSDGNLYRTKEEIELWKSRCPIKRFERVLEENGVFTREEISAVEAEAQKVIEDAAEYAKASPNPTVEHALDNVYEE
jgi:TPP-dependent pyruvate/acetoin dehydrogenase alpha subunit